MCVCAYMRRVYVHRHEILDKNPPKWDEKVEISEQNSWKRRKSYLHLGRQFPALAVGVGLVASAFALLFFALFLFGGAVGFFSRGVLGGGFAGGQGLVDESDGLFALGFGAGFGRSGGCRCGDVGRRSRC